MDRRQEQIGRNEALFREVNERVKGVNAAFALVSERADFVCECGDATCVERVTMSLDEYEQLRTDATLFAIVPGHEAPDVEDVVVRREGYDVVRKKPGEPAELAIEEFPRS